MSAQIVEVRAHFGQRVERAMAAKLGRCWRCMGWTAALLVLSWTVVVMMTLSGTAPVFVVAATLLATPVTALALAHTTAFVVRRTAKPADIFGEALTSPVAERGCGCGQRVPPASAGADVRG